MKSLTIFACAAVLAAAVGPPAALAEQPEGKGKKEAGPPTFVLMDCADLACARDPQQVGTVISVGNSEVFTLLTVPDTLGQLHNIFLRVNRAKIRVIGEVFFEGQGCTEPAWISSGVGQALTIGG